MEVTGADQPKRAGARRRAGRWLRREVSWPLRIGPPEPNGWAPASPFRRMAVVHLFSTAGDALVTVALAGSVFVSVSLTAARGRTALGLVCTLLPFLVVGPFIGRLIDAAPGGRRAMLCLASLGRVLACLLMAHWVNGLLFFPAAFLALVSSKAYLVSRAAILPSIVERSVDLVPANSKLAVGSAASSLVAGVVGAGLYKLEGTPSVLYLDAVVLLVCAALTTRLQLIHPPTTGPRAAAVTPRVLQTHPAPAAGPAVGVSGMAARVAGAAGGIAGVAGGMARVAGGPAGHAPGVGGEEPTLPAGGLAAVALSMASMRASAGLMTALVVFDFRRQGAPLYWYGLVGAASVVGNLGGAVLAPLVRERAREEWTVPSCGLIIGIVALLVIDVSAMDRRPSALILAVTVTLMAAVAKLSFDSLVQREAVAARRGTAFARLEACFQLVWVLAALVPVGVNMPLVAGFAAVVAMTLGGVFADVEGLRRARRDLLPGWWPGVVRPDRPQPVSRAPVPSDPTFSGTVAAVPPAPPGASPGAGGPTGGGAQTGGGAPAGAGGLTGGGDRGSSDRPYGAGPMGGGAGSGWPVRGWPAGRWPAPPESVSPGYAPPGSVSPGYAPPGSSSVPHGSVAPRSASYGSVPPWSASHGSASHGSAPPWSPPEGYEQRRSSRPGADGPGAVD